MQQGIQGVAEVSKSRSKIKPFMFVSDVTSFAQSMSPFQSGSGHKILHCTQLARFTYCIVLLWLSPTANGSCGVTWLCPDTPSSRTWELRCWTGTTDYQCYIMSLSSTTSTSIFISFIFFLKGKSDCVRHRGSIGWRGIAGYGGRGGSCAGESLLGVLLAPFPRGKGTLIIPACKLHLLTIFLLSIITSASLRRCYFFRASNIG